MTALNEILSVERILTNGLESTKKLVLERISELACLQATAIDEQTVFQALCQREKLGATAIGHGVAIPHCRLESLTAPIGVLAILRKGIDFGADDEQSVDLFFALIVPDNEEEEHLSLLAQIASLLSSEDTRTALRQAESAEACLKLLAQ